MTVKILTYISLPKHALDILANTNIPIKKKIYIVVDVVIIACVRTHFYKGDEDFLSIIHFEKSKVCCI